jgi:mannose/fructose/N-acetylgalactosamine-specific phosphotransferase system component IIB
MIFIFIAIFLNDITSINTNNMNTTNNKTNIDNKIVINTENLKEAYFA